MTRNNTWTGANDFSGGRIRLPETTFASLPSASTVTGQVFRVTDCATAACTAGSGTVTSLRVSTGSAYQTLGDGAAASTTAHLEYYPMASYNSNSSTGSWGGWSGGSQGFSDFAGLGGNQKMYGAAFNANTTTSMTYSTILPDTWDGNSVPVKVYASNSSGLTGTAYVTISSMCPTLSASSQQMNQSYTFSNSVSMSQVITSTYGRFVMSGTLPMTGCSAGSPVLYQVSRTGNNGTTDTMNSPLYVFGMSVSITY